MIEYYIKYIHSLLSLTQNISNLKEVILTIDEGSGFENIVSSIDGALEKAELIKKTTKNSKKTQLTTSQQTQLTLFGIPFDDKPPHHDYHQHFNFVLHEIEKSLNESSSLSLSQKLSQVDVIVKDIIKSLDEGVIVYDHKNVITHTNKAADQFLISNSKAASQKRIIFYQGDNPEPIPIEEQPSKLALSGTEIKNKKYTIYTKDFTNRIAVSVDANPIKNNANKIIGAIITVTDKSSIDETKKEQRRQIDLLNQASSLAKVGYWDLDLNTEQIYWSEVTREIHETEEGFNPKLQEGINFYDEESRPLIGELVAKGMQTGEGWDVKLKIVTAKGNTKWVRSISKCYMTNGRVNRMAGVFQDITKEKKDEDRLIKSTNKILSLNKLLYEQLEKTDSELIKTKERTSNLYNNAPDLMASIDTKSRQFIDCNEQTAKVLGYTKKELIGMSFLDIYHTSCHKKAIKSFDDFLKVGVSTNVRLTLEKKNGSTVQVTLNASAIRDENGNIVQNNAVWRDISDLVTTENKLKTFNKELEERVDARTNELVKANNELEDFTYMATHDLKAPVANVRGHIGIIKNELGAINNEVINECIKWIDKSLNVAENKIHAIVRVAQHQSQALERTEIIDVKTEIMKVISDMNLYITENKAIITFDNDNTFEVNFNRENFRSIFFNLIHNAIKYKRPNVLPKIVININSKNNLPYITVKDNGVGFNSNKQEDRIFRMFQRLHDHVEGDGMGLHLVKKIIDKSGGSISVDSEINKGATFKVYFKQDTLLYEKIK